MNPQEISALLIFYSGIKLSNDDALICGKLIRGIKEKGLVITEVQYD